MDKKLNQTLAGLKRANWRLRNALTKTVLSWPHVNQCWVDVINTEPTVDLESHKLKNKTRTE